MIFTENKLRGVFIIDPEKLEDERGFFARTFCQKEFGACGINSRFVQCSISFNREKGTLRGMHYQAPPHEETRLIRCISGAIYDVILDLRQGSPTYRQWSTAELSGENYRAIYVPEGFAHGFQTLEPNTVVFYQMSEFYHPESVRGVRWDDPLYGIRWPLEPQCISARDASFPLTKTVR